MEISEFLVLSQTSSLTLSLAGVLKEIFQLVLAVELSNEVLSLNNIVGLILCLGGIVIHVCQKYWSLGDNSSVVQLESDNQFDIGDQYLSKLDTTDNSRTYNDEPDGVKITSNNGTNVVIAYKIGSQKTPLLNYNSESDDDATETDSKVLFDILKRRDETR